MTTLDEVMTSLDEATRRLSERELVGRVVLEHPDGRRLSIKEERAYSAAWNPFKPHSYRVLMRHGVTRLYYTDPARGRLPSLIEAGWVIVADIDEQGHEVPRDAALYRGEGLLAASLANRRRPRAG